ncbi:MAG TPA: branched-chain amino acid ABC transporter ATP-binding protein/permease [Stellaceae bacterium]
MIGVCAAIAGAVLCLFLSGYHAYLAATVATTTLVGVGLNVLLGLAGEVSLGQVGFVALGAYGVGVLTAAFHWPFLLALPVAVAAVTAVAALIALPALRVSGPYLAMLTIAFAFIVVSAATEWQSLTGGASGLAGIPPPVVAGHRFKIGETAALCVVAAALVLFGFARLKRSPLGMGMRAGADAPIAARGLGIDTLATRALAFVIAAALAGIAGGLQAALTGFIAPNSFPFTASILLLLVVMVGGVGATLGPLFGAVVVVLLPQLVGGLAEYQLLVFGAGLFIVLRAAPRGIAGLLPERRRTELTEPPLLQLAAVQTAPLRVENVSVAFGGVQAVAEVGFTAAPGAVTSVIGPNGAGKTTLLNLISGMQPADAGSVRIDACMLSGVRAHRIARAGIARTWQTTQLFGSLSVLDNIRAGLLRGRLIGTASAKRALGLLRFVRYGGDPARSAADLPHVDRRLVEIARALATDPLVLLLDEPAAGLDPADTARLGETLRRIAGSGIAVVLVEHDMGLVMGISDHVLVLDAGRKIAEGPPAAVRADPAVRAAYLGAGTVPVTARLPGRAGGERVLEVSGLGAGYGSLRVLRDIALTVRQGEMLAVLGPNGAGKSTLMRALSGLLRPVSGSVRFAGTEVAAAPAHRVAREGLVLVPEGRLVFPRLSVRDNLRLGAGVRPDRDAAIEAILRRFPKLAARLHLSAGMLSGGEQQMLALARGLLAQPKLLLLDEPSLGLAPVVVEELFAALAELRGENMTLLVVDQMADLAIALADRCLVLGSGRVVQSCAAAELHDMDALHRLYMADPVAASGGA